MRVPFRRIAQIHRMLGPQEALRLRNSAARAQRLENKWVRKLDDLFRSTNRDMLKQLLDTGRIRKSDINFDEFFMEHSLNIMREGIRETDGLPPVPPKPKRLAKKTTPPPEAKIPKKFKDLMAMWDDWRKKKKVPPRQRAMAERVKSEYLKKVQSVWVRYGQAFRDGKIGEDVVTKHISRASGAAYSRAKMITETETTYYYNKARRSLYDQSEDVTHYLFVPIRDMATTKWCKTRRFLVYKKGSAVLDRETPPIHWNCRSELLPLTPLNPRHLKLIENKSLWRENNSPHPLPPGWSKRAA